MQSQHPYVLHTQFLRIQQNQLNVQSVLLKLQLDITMITISLNYILLHNLFLLFEVNMKAN